MQLADFKIGEEFWLAGVEPRAIHLRCTDIGTRGVVAIKLDKGDPSWYNGPPYAVYEIFFDEDDIQVCYKTQEEASRA